MYLYFQDLKIIENFAICCQCQKIVSNFTNVLDSQQLENHIIDDRNEKYVPICTFSTLSVRLVKDKTIEKICNDIIAKKDNQVVENGNRHSQFGIDKTNIPEIDDSAER